MKIGDYDITTGNVASYVRGNTHKFLVDNGRSMLSEIELAQVEIRKELCAPCLKLGKCSVCNCKVPNLFYDPKRKDSKLLWGPMISKQSQWDELVKLYEVSDKSESFAQFYSKKYEENADIFKSSPPLQGSPKGSHKTDSFGQAIPFSNDLIKAYPFANKKSYNIINWDLNKSISEKDLGKLSFSETITNYKFVIPNTSNQTLKIKEIFTTCDCISVSFTEGDILVGSHFEVSVDFKPNLEGDFHRLIIVDFEPNVKDTIINHIPLVIKGTVLPETIKE